MKTVICESVEFRAVHKYGDVLMAGKSSVDVGVLEMKWKAECKVEGKLLAGGLYECECGRMLVGFSGV